eukprot:4428967-Ditylum_brightwellii.AAC.1
MEDDLAGIYPILRKKMDIIGMDNNTGAHVQQHNGATPCGTMANNIGVLSIAGQRREDGHMNLALRYLDVLRSVKAY